jgi:hypothetical protein
MRFSVPCAEGDEAREHQALAQRVEAAWRELGPGCASGSDAAAQGSLEELLRRVHPALCGELLRDRAGGRVAVVTPRERRSLRPLAAFVADRSPPLDGLSVVSHRPPDTFEAMVEVVRREHALDLGSAKVRAGFSRGHLLELVIYGAGFGGSLDERALLAAERAAEVLLGERVMDDWVGRVDAEPLVGRGSLRVVQADAAQQLSLRELPESVGRAVEALAVGLPDLSSLGALREGWVLFETEPEAATDYTAQDDVALAGSALPEMLKCFLEGAPFSSKRFVRGAVTIAYLKVDARGTPFEDRVAARAKLEDELAAALGARRLGAVVGNGLGLRYVYIDVALAPDPAALTLVRDVARAAGVSKRSWVLFCDSDLGEEWAGVWPETPTPPGLG